MPVVTMATELALRNRQLSVADGKPRADHGVDARFVGYLHAVGDRRKASDTITAPLRSKPKLESWQWLLPARRHAKSGPRPKRRADILGKDYGITLGVLHDLVW